MEKGKITPSLQSAPTRGGEFAGIVGLKGWHLRNLYEYFIVIIEKKSVNGKAPRAKEIFFSRCLTGKGESVKKVCAAAGGQGAK